jgi:hypothetical protein
MEGKAPTGALRAAFERFKQVLTSLYVTAKNLNVTLNNDIRGVFDRMLSANVEVEVAAQEGGFVAKTDEEMTTLGMVPADKTFAKKLIDITVQKATRKLTQARNKGYKDNRSTWKEQARREMNRENPIYVTMDTIIKEKKQIDKDTFIERYGEEAVSRLPNKRVLKKNGQNIDMVADFYGFEDADQMVTEFLKVPPFSEAVNQRVNEKQAAHDALFTVEDYIVDIKEYRDYLNLMARYINGNTVDQNVIDKGIKQNTSRWQKEARAEITAESPELTGSALETAINERVETKIELFKERKAKPSAITTDTLKALAFDTMSAKTVRDARQVHKFLSAMKKAASDERRAILRKDWGEASRHNELARFNYEMSTLSVKIREEVDTILARAKRIGKRKKKETVDFQHKEAILHLIDRYNLASLVPQDPTQSPDYDALFKGDEFGNDGYPKPLFLLNNTIGDFRDLRMEQMRDLDSAIRYLEGQGRVDKTGMLSDGETPTQDRVDQSTEKMDTVKPQKVWEEGSMMRKLTDRTRKWFSFLDSLTFIAKSLDGYTNLGKVGLKGPVELYVIDPIKIAIDNLIQDERRIKAEIEPHLDQIRKTNRRWRKQFGRRMQIDGAPVPFLMRQDGQTKGWKAHQIWSVILNTGNKGEKSNYENMLAGYQDITPATIEKLKDLLSVDDMRAIQGIWDVIDSLYAQTDAQFLKTKNYHMTKVRATPFIFRGHEFKGGYYPIVHDRNLSYKVADRKKVEDFFNNEGAAINVPYTKSSFSIERVNGVALPILLDLGVIDTHFKNTLQYIHFTDVVSDAHKITSHHDFRRSAERILGKDVYATIQPALQHIANPKRKGLDVAGAQGVEWLRGLSTAYILAWNTGVALKQPLSTFSAIHDLTREFGKIGGLRAYIDGFSSTLASPSVSYQKMTELSNYMKDRLTSFDRELKSAFLKLSAEQRGIYFGDTKVTWQDVKNFGFWQIRVADTVTVLPIWHGAFNAKLNADQSNLQEAIRFADDVVRNTQPSAQPLDLSTWQRDAGAIRLFSQFQTFTVGKYGQRQRLHYRAWRNGSISTVDYAFFNFMDAFVPLVTINLLMSFLHGEDIGDDETIKDMVVNVISGWVFMGVPVAGSIIRSYVSGFGDPLDSPVLETGNKLVRGVIKGVESLDGFENKKDRDKALWGIAHALSILMGVPVSKIVQKAIKGAKQKKGVPIAKFLVPAPKK